MCVLTYIYSHSHTHTLSHSLLLLTRAEGGREKVGEQGKNKTSYFISTSGRGEVTARHSSEESESLSGCAQLGFIRNGLDVHIRVP